jgi:hypothetical protein
MFNYRHKFYPIGQGYIYNKHNCRIIMLHNRLYTRIDQKVVEINQDLARLLIDRVELFQNAA